MLFENGIHLFAYVPDVDVFIQPGDLFEVCMVNDKITYARNAVNGTVVCVDPVIDQPWELYKSLRWKRAWQK
ncbi:MAG: hypothetical protein K9L17_11425 [Clostridiales bacterium]|nr:hypothetical protein [Clostridiales bacterium]MCF8023292.1 hypothetical protein [Clostridiales bacterium]